MTSGLGKASGDIGDESGLAMGDFCQYTLVNWPGCPSE